MLVYSSSRRQKVNINEYNIEEIQFGSFLQCRGGDSSVRVIFFPEKGRERLSQWYRERDSTWKLRGTMELAKVWEKTVVSFLQMLESGHYRRPEPGPLKLKAREIQNIVAQTQKGLRRVK